MARRDRNFVILWPEYFDGRNSRSTGRRVPAAWATNAPHLADIAAAAKTAGYQVTVEEGKAYPRFWWKRRGRVLVHGQHKKSEVLRKVGAALASD